MTPKRGTKHATAAKGEGEGEGRQVGGEWSKNEARLVRARQPND